MKKIIHRIREKLEILFHVSIEQNVDAKGTKSTTITQTTNVFNFIIPSIILLIVLVLGGIWGLVEYQKSKYNTSPMSGNLNIVVAQFSDMTSKECKLNDKAGLLIADAFYIRLNQDITNDQFYRDSGLQVELRSPSEIYPLSGESVEQITKSAAKLAEKINAHIVVYGVLTCSAITQTPSFEVFFYVAPSSISDAQELLGEFSFSSNTLYGEINPGEDFVELNKNLQRKIEIISLVVKSIASFLGENYPQSLGYITTALDSSLWDTQDGQEVLYIIAGNIDSKYALNLQVNDENSKATEAIEQARSYYENANRLTIEQGKGRYARAFVGLAGVEGFYSIRISIQTNDLKDMDLSALDKKLEMLDKAESAPYQPETASIPEKVAFERAQIELTLYQLDSDPKHLTHAMSYYKNVVQAYEDGDIQIREIAAHSHSGLAIIARYEGEQDIAIDEYKSAIRITRIPSLQAQYLLQIGNTYYQNGDLNNALEYYKEVLKRKKDLQNRVPPSTISEIENRVLEIEAILSSQNP